MNEDSRVKIPGSVPKAIHIVLSPVKTANGFGAHLESLVERQKVAELENTELTQLPSMLINAQVKVT